MTRDAQIQYMRAINHTVAEIMAGRPLPFSRTPIENPPRTVTNEEILAIAKDILITNEQTNPPH